MGIIGWDHFDIGNYRIHYFSFFTLLLFNKIKMKLLLVSQFSNFHAHSGIFVFGKNLAIIKNLIAKTFVFNIKDYENP